MAQPPFAGERVILQRLARLLRDAPWLTPKRAKAYSALACLGTVVAVLALVATSHGGLDRSGKPLGTDFLSFWTASDLALSGEAAAAYDPATHYRAQQALFGADVPYFAFFYPPIFLLACLPLALLPYFASLAAWLSVTGLAWYAMLRRLAAGRFGAVAILAYPAAFLTVTHGQNAFLTAALLGGGLLAWNRRPVTAGILLGCLVIKPHLGVAIPFALIASGRWRTLAAATATVLVLLALSYLILGPAAWREFLDSAPLVRAALEDDLVGHAKMQSVFAAVRGLGGGLASGYGMQVVSAVASLACVVALARRGSPATGGAVATAPFLASPFILDYDMTLLAIPIAWLAAEGMSTGFRPWEKTVLLAAFILPGVARITALHIGLPLAPLVVGALLAVLTARGWRANPRTA